MFRSSLAALIVLLTCAVPASLRAQPVDVVLTASPASGTVPLTTTVSATAQWSHLPSRLMQIQCSNGHTFSQAAFPHQTTVYFTSDGNHTCVATACDQNGCNNSPTLTIPVAAPNSPPQITSVSTDASLYVAPATVTVTASASDPDNNISRVDFYRNGTFVGSDTVAPYGVTWTGLGAGTYSAYGVVYDSVGASATSPTVAFTVSVPQTPYGGTAWPIPGRIEAENYDYGSATIAYYDSTSGNSGGAHRTDDVDIAACGDPGCGYAVNANVTGEWLEYTVNVAQTATYNAVIRYAHSASAALHIEIDGQNVTGSVNLPSNSSWTTYTTHAKNAIVLTAGIHVMRVYLDQGGFNLNWIEFQPNQGPLVTLTSPATGSVFTAPASITINASASDTDGSVAKVEFYSGQTLLGADTTAPYAYSMANVGRGTYSLSAKAYDNLNLATQSAPVTVTVNELPNVSVTAPSGGATFVLPTSVTIAASATDADGSISKVEFFAGATLLGTDTTSPFSVSWAPTFGGSYNLTARAYDNYSAARTSSVVAISLAQGPYNPLSPSSPGAPWTIPGRIEFENYDVGGNGVSFGDATPGNSGGYRADDVDLFACVGDTGCGYAIGGVHAGEWLEYTVNITQTGTYNILARYASFEAGASFHIEVDGVNVTGAVSAPSNSSWTVFTTAAKYGVNLTAGTRVLRFVSDTGGYNLNWLEIQGNGGPTVSMTGPGAGAMFTAPADIQLQASAVDSDGSVSRVEFYNGSMLLGTDTTAPYTYDWNGVGRGSYSVTAKAYDNLNVASQSAALAFVVNERPTAAVSAPTSGATFTLPTSVPIVASASDVDGTIEKVEFYVDGALHSTDTSSPYTATWNPTAAGAHSILAKAYDNRGATQNSPSVAVQVSQGPYGGAAWPVPGRIEFENYDLGGQGAAYHDTTAGNGPPGGTPSYRSDDVDIWACGDAGCGHALSGVAAGEWLEYTINVTQGGTYTILTRYATYDSNLSFHIEVDGVNVTGPINAAGNGSWTVFTTTVKAGVVFPAGQHVLRFVADSGNYNLNWFEIGANQAPTVTLTAPTSASPQFTAPATIDLAATASDADGVINRVEFYNGATKLGTATSLPYTYRWENAPSGTYSLTAKAFDDGNLSTTSAAVSVVVNALPTATLTAPVQQTPPTTFTLPASVALAATASDSDGTIDKVEFFVDGGYYSTDTSSPYTGSYSGSPGDHTISARAIDNRGGVGPLTPPVTVKIVAPPPQNPYDPNCTDIQGITCLTAVPGRIQAEHYDLGGQGVAYNDDAGNSGTITFRGDDVDMTDGYDVADGTAQSIRVTSIKAGEWLEYTTFVKSAGSYRIGARVTSRTPGGKFHIELDGVNVSGTLSVPETTSEYDWRTVFAPGARMFAANTSPLLKLVAEAGEFDLNWFEIRAEMPASARLVAPSSGYRLAKDSQVTLVASATDPENDPVQVTFFAAPTSTGQQVGLGTDATAPYAAVWSPTQAGDYDLWAVASAPGAPPASAPTREKSTPTRVHVLAASAPFPTAGHALPNESNPITIIQAEDYDAGGPRAAYFDTTEGNAGGAYRPEDVDIQYCFDGQCEFYVGGIDYGEWLTYTVDVPPMGGTYQIDFVVRSVHGDGAFRLDVDGQPTVAKITIPDTSAEEGGWKRVTHWPITLSGGRHVLRFVSEGRNFEFDSMTFVSNQAPIAQLIRPAVESTTRHGVEYEFQAFALNPDLDLSRVDILVDGALNGPASQLSSHLYSLRRVMQARPNEIDSIYRIQSRATDLGGAHTDSGDVLLHVTPRTGSVEFVRPYGMASPCSVGVDQTHCVERIKWSTNAETRTRLWYYGGPNGPGIPIDTFEPIAATDPPTTRIRELSYTFDVPQRGILKVRMDSGAELARTRIDACFKTPMVLTVAPTMVSASPATIEWEVAAGCVGLGMQSLTIQRDGQLLRTFSRVGTQSIAFPVGGVDTFTYNTQSPPPQVCYKAVGETGEETFEQQVCIQIAGASAVVPKLTIGANPTIVVPNADTTLSASVQDFSVAPPVVKYYWNTNPGVPAGGTPICGVGGPENACPGAPYSFVWKGLKEGQYYVHGEALDGTRSVRSNDVFIDVTNEVVVDDDPFIEPAAETSDRSPAVGTTGGAGGVSGGAGTYSIPIVVPPGRRGMQPSLSLDYSSRAGNGIAGMGWSLSGVSSIHRCPKTVAQDGEARAVTFDDSDPRDVDPLCLDGQRLVLTSGSYGTASAVYRTELNSHVRVTQYGALDDAWFLVEHKDGERLYYGHEIGGTQIDARQRVRLGEAPGDPAATLAWNVYRRSDRANNAITYHYDGFRNGAGGVADSSELLLTRIDYTGLGAQAGTRQVLFSYGARPASGDIASSYLSGKRVDSTTRLTGITTRLLGADVNTYALWYGDASPHSGRSVLRKVTLCGRDANGAVCMPETLFEWSDEVGTHSAPVRYDFPMPPETPRPGVRSLEFVSFVSLGDLDGDGFVENLRRLVRAFYWDDPANTAQPPAPEVFEHLVRMDASRGPPQLFDAASLGATSLPVDAYQRVDLDNDGRVELVGELPDLPYPVQPANCGSAGCKFSSKLVVYRLKRGATSWDASGFEQSEPLAATQPVLTTRGRVYSFTGPSGQQFVDVINDSHRHFTDIDSDGRVDLVVELSGHGPPTAPCTQTDGTGNFEGATLHVYMNTTGRATKDANGAMQSAPITFAAPEKYCLPSLGQETPFGSSAAGQKRHRYASIGEIRDFDGDSHPDLVANDPQDARLTRVHFGSAVPGRWNLDRNSAELVSDLVSPAMGEDELSKVRWNYMDVNGDGLQDVRYDLDCGDDGFRHGIRLNTGRRGADLFAKPIATRVGGETAAPENCSPRMTPNELKRPSFDTLADVDTDGRQELLRPNGFYKRVCTRLYNYQDGNIAKALAFAVDADAPRIAQEIGVEEQPNRPAPPGTDTEVPGSPTVNDPDPLYCPENPVGTAALPPDSQAMYGAGYGRADDSLYTVEATHFREYRNADGTVGYEQASNTNTGIVLNSTGGTRSDFYGDGLEDGSFVYGCRSHNEAEPSCEPIVGGEPRPADVANYGLYVNENVGAGELGANYAPLLPDLMTAAEHKRDYAFKFGRIDWIYQPLSSKAGRVPREGVTPMPLYTVDRSKDAETKYAGHFFFTSSMPVVESYMQATGLGTRVHQFWYRDALYDPQGRGFRGFGAIIEEVDAIVSGGDAVTGTRSLTEFEQIFPKVGLVGCTATQTSAADWRTLVCPTTPIATLASVSPGTMSVSRNTYETRLSQADVVLDVSDAATFDPVTGALVTRRHDEFDYDDVANVTEERHDVWDVDPKTSAATIHRSGTTTRTFAVDTVNWWLDRISKEVVTGNLEYTGTSALVGLAAAPRTTSRLFAFDDPSRRATCVSTYLGNTTIADCAQEGGTGWESKVTTGYDSYGNAISETVRYRDPTGTLGRGSGTSWESTGYFPRVQTNAAGHETCMAFNAKDGTIASTRRLMHGTESCDNPIGGLLEQFDYDAFGRQVRHIHPKTAIDDFMAPDITTARQWCGALHPCPPEASGAVHREVVQQAGAPKGIRYLDIDGAAVAEESSTGFSAGSTRVLRKRDALGRVLFESIPSFGWEQTFGTHSRYDAAGRVIAKWQTKTSLAGPGGLVEHLLTRYRHSGLRTCINVELSGTPEASYLLPADCPDGNPSSVEKLVMSRDIASDGKPIRTRDAMTGTTSFWYDGAGNALALQDAKQVVTYATYDDLGRRLTSDDPNQGLHSFTYDGLGQVRTATDARDWVTTTYYDALGRVTTRTATEGSPTVTATVTDTYAYDQRGAGLLDSESRSVSTTLVANNEFTQRTYSYDKYYRPLSISATFGSDTTPLVWKQAYDRRFGRVKQTTWPRPAGAPLVSIGYAYNAAGFMLGEFRPQDQAEKESKFIRHIDSIDARMQPTSIRLSAMTGAAAMTRVVQTDPASGMTTRVCVGAGDGSSCANSGYTGNILDIAYTYDGYGNVKSQEQRGQRDPGAGAGNVISETYTYDALHRMTAISGPAPTTLEYDSVGNLIAKTDFSEANSGGPTKPYTYGATRNTKTASTDGGPNAVMTVKSRVANCTMLYQYDNNGNRTRREWSGSTCPVPNAVETASYSFDNHMTRIARTDTGLSTTFRYGPDGQRYEQVLALDASSTRTTRYYQGFEHDRVANGGATSDEYRYDVAPGVLFLGGARSGFHFVHGDRLGSTSTVTDANGGNAKRHAFGPFGEPRDSSWNQTGTMQAGLVGTEVDLTAPLVTRRGFTQHEQMDRHRLTHMNGRMYDYELGRFLSVDPIVQFPLNGQSLNPYSYVLNSPFAGTDPTGYQSAVQNDRWAMSGGFSAGTAVLINNIDAQFAAEKERYRNGYELQGPSGTDMCKIGATGRADGIGALGTRQLFVGPPSDEMLFGWDALRAQSNRNYYESLDGLKKLEDGLGNILALTPLGGRGGITGNQPINPLNNQPVSLDEYHSALTFVFTLVAPAPKTLRAPQAAPVLTEAAGSATVAHKNSLSYVGETHVYVIRGPDGTPIKIGESAQGIRSSDGASRRAEEQVRRLNREVGPGHESEIRKTFDNKADARRYETAFIERFRRWFGQDALPGNKTNR